MLSLARGSFWYKCPFVPLIVRNFSPGSLHPMATPTASSSSNKMEQQPPDRSLLQLDADINQVNWSHVRHYMTERFSHPPTCFVQRQGVALLDHVDRSQICDHILNLRPCPSFFDACQPCKMYHPEFLLQNDVLLWTPRTWPCHAYQRRRDLWKKCWNCEIPHCGQLHRQGWEHSEMFGFRAWVAAIEPRYWFSVYCLEPNYSGRLPLYTIDFQDLQNCLATQPFITPELHDKHDWKDSVPPPPTYILEVPSRVCPLASNFKEPERVQRRKMQHRDPTPRGHRSTPRDFTPQRREFLAAQTPSDHVHPGPSPRFGPGTPPRSRQPTGSENWRPSNFPPATSGPPTSFGPSTSNIRPHGPQRIAAPLSDPVPMPSPSYAAMPPDHAQPSAGPEFDWNADSDHDLPLPPAQLKVSPSPVWAPPTFSTDIVTNVPNWFTKTIPPRHCRDLHTFMTGGSEKFAPFADWQLPSRLLEDNFRAFRSFNRDPGSNVAMTDWGVLFRQRSLYSNRGEYDEQTLTIPLPTNTADPELSILTSFFYMKMQRELSLAFSNSRASAQTITQAQLRDWLKFAGDHHRLARTQQGVAQQFNDNVANVVLDIINANIPHYQRSWADSDPNITVDQTTSRLRFCSWEAYAISCDFLPRLLTPGEDQPQKNVHRFTVFGGRWLQVRIDQRTRCALISFAGCWPRTRIDPHLQTFSILPVTCDVWSFFYLYFNISFPVVTMIVFDFDDYTLSHNPHQFAYMPTFDTIECQLEKKRCKCVATTEEHTLQVLLMPYGQRPRTRRHIHSHFWQFASDDHIGKLVSCEYITIGFSFPLRLFHDT